MDAKLNAKLEEAVKEGSLRSASVVPTAQNEANNSLNELRSIRKEYGASSLEYQDAAKRPSQQAWSNDS